MAGVESTLLIHVVHCCISSATADGHGSYDIVLAADTTLQEGAVAFMGSVLHAFALTPSVQYVERHFAFPSAAVRDSASARGRSWTNEPGLFAIALGALDTLDAEVPERWAGDVLHWPARVRPSRMGRILAAVKAAVDNKLTASVSRRHAAAPAAGGGGGGAAPAASALATYMAQVADAGADGAVVGTVDEQVGVLSAFGLTFEEPLLGAGVGDVAARARWRTALDSLVEERVRMLPGLEQAPVTLAMAYSRARQAARAYASRAGKRQALRFVAPAVSAGAMNGPPAGFFPRWQFEMPPADFNAMLADVGRTLHGGLLAREAVSQLLPLQGEFAATPVEQRTLDATLAFLQRLLPGRVLTQPPAPGWSAADFRSHEWYTLMRAVQDVLAARGAGMASPGSIGPTGTPDVRQHVCFSDEEDDDESILCLPEEEWRAQMGGGPLKHCVSLASGDQTAELIAYLFGLDFKSAPVLLRTFLQTCVRKLTVPKRARDQALADPIFPVLSAVNRVRQVVGRWVQTRLTVAEFAACPFTPRQRARLWSLLRRLHPDLWGKALPLFGRNDVTRAKHVDELNLAELGMALKDMLSFAASLWTSIVAKTDGVRMQQIVYQFGYQGAQDVATMRLSVIAPVLADVFARPLRRLQNSGIYSPDYNAAGGGHVVCPVETVHTLDSRIGIDVWDVKCAKSAGWLERARVAHAAGQSLQEMPAYAESTLPGKAKKASARAAASRAPAKPATAKGGASASDKAATRQEERRAAANAEAGRKLEADLGTDGKPARDRSRSRSRDRRRRSRSRGRSRSRSRDRSSRGGGDKPAALKQISMQVFKTEWTSFVQKRACSTVTTLERTACPYLILCGACTPLEWARCAFCHDPQMPETPREDACKNFLGDITNDLGCLPGSVGEKLKQPYVSAVDRCYRSPASFSGKKRRKK